MSYGRIFAEWWMLDTRYWYRYVGTGYWIVTVGFILTHAQYHMLEYNLYCIGFLWFFGLPGFPKHISIKKERTEKEKKNSFVHHHNNHIHNNDNNNDIKTGCVSSLQSSVIAVLNIEHRHEFSESIQLVPSMCSHKLFQNLAH